MRLTVYKSSEYLAIFENGQYSPVTAKSLNELKRSAVMEVYRFSAFFEKKLPKNSDDIEIIKTVSVKNTNDAFIGDNFLYATKNDYENLISVLYQTAFSYKIMVESFESVSLNDLFSFDLDIALERDEQIMSFLSKIIDKTTIMPLNDGYALLLKVYFELTLKAKNFYYAKKIAGKKISNLFYFGI